MMTGPVGADRHPFARRRSTTLHLISIAVVACGVGITVCGLVDLARSGSAAAVLLASGLLAAGTGEVVRRVTELGDVTPGQVFQAVAATWIVVSVVGSLPFWWSGMIPYWPDALFESISGFSCSGSTILDSIESHSPGLLYWRQMTQWFGGMGVVVLAVAVLPFIGVGGMELISAEAPGPDSDRLVPRVSETARRLWVVYGGFTAVMSIALMFAGADWFQATAHAMATVATGGFSTFDNSTAGFDSLAIEIILMAGMLVGGINFGLHHKFLTGERGAYRRSSETRLFLGLVAAAALGLVLLNTNDGAALGDALRGGTFTAVTLLTSTGFGNGEVGNFVTWVPGAQFIVLSMMLIGGCSGSTAGGSKVIRTQVMLRHAWRELRRSRHPRAVLVVRQDGAAVAEETVARIAGFVLLYVALIVLGTLVVVATGSDLNTAIGGVVGAIGNMGPGFGEAGPLSNFRVFSEPARWVIMWLMLVGRLEIFPMLLMFTAASNKARAVGQGRRRAGRRRMGELLNR